MATSDILVNGVAPTGPVLLTAGATCNLTLADLTGAGVWTKRFVGASESITYPTITLTAKGQVSFTVPAAPNHGYGLSMIFESVVGDSVTRVLLCVGTTTQIAACEEFQRGPEGWIHQLNENARGGTQPTAMLKAFIGLSATTPSIITLWSRNSDLTTANVILARTGVGVYTLTWPSGSFPPKTWVPESSPSYYGLSVATEQSGNVVTIYASNGGNANMTDTGSASITVYGE